MNQFNLRETIERIIQMEGYFDTLNTAVLADPTSIHNDPTLRECLLELLHYYEGGQWLCDYELDALLVIITEHSHEVVRLIVLASEGENEHGTCIWMKHDVTKNLACSLVIL